MTSDSTEQGKPRADLAPQGVGQAFYADEHAAETIAGYAFLRPVENFAEWGRRKASPLGS